MTRDRSAPTVEPGARAWRGEGGRCPLLLLLTIPALLAAGPLWAQPAPIDGLDDYVEWSMEAWDVPGLALGVVKDDSLVHARGYGVRESGRDGGVDANTLFAAASTTKAFTTTALAMLIDEGELTWDDRVSRHLPGFQLHDPWVTRQLTVRDLVTHRSGLPRCDRVWYGTSFDRSEILRRIRHCQPTTSFRAAYGYQNVMYLAAGHIVSELSGTRWDAFLEDRIFAPLQMERSNTSVDSLEGMSNVAVPHQQRDGSLRPIPWRNMDNIGPAGSINSSVVEMARWIRFQLGQGIFEGDTLLPAEAVDEMHSPETLMRWESPFLETDSHYRAYGLGWALHEYRGLEVVDHAGGIDGMRSQVTLVPELDLGLVVLANRGGPSLGLPLMYRIIDAYLDARETDWTRRVRSVLDSLDAEATAGERRLREARKQGTRPSRPLVDYAGVYSDSLYGTVEIDEDGGGLTLGFHGFEDDLEHWHLDTFQVDWRSDLPTEQSLASSLVTFRLNARGEVKTLEVPGMGTFERDVDDDAER